MNSQLVRRYWSTVSQNTYPLYKQLQKVYNHEIKLFKGYQQQLQKCADLLYKQKWCINSTSGTSTVVLQHMISNDEFLSIYIQNDESHDVQRLSSQINLYTLHCFHNIGVTYEPSLLIQKQLVYTSLNIYCGLSSNSNSLSIIHVDGAINVKDSIDDIHSCIDNKAYSGRNAAYISSELVDAFVK